MKGRAEKLPAAKKKIGKSIWPHQIRIPKLASTCSHETVQQMIETSVRVLLQRIPGTLILLLFPLLMLGPYYAPVFFSVYFIFLTFAVFFLSVRSALGIFATWVKFIVEKDVDWMKLRTEEMHRRKLTGEAEMAVTDIVHVVVVPNYKESMETLVETLDVLGSHDLASTNYVVCLAMEETEDGCVEKAEALMRMYSEAFRLLTYTVHPKNIAGEIRGKSSNTNWACTELHKRLTTHGSLSLIPRIVVPATTGAVSRASTATLSEDPGPERHIFTCMDADTCFAADYFACVAYRYVSMSAHARKAAMFIPSLVFDRNSQSVNPVVRMIDVGWSASQMAYFIPYYPFKYATSAYSVPMELAEAVNFWDTSREAIGEDVHMTFKCMFATGGRLRVIPIASPASQFNVVGKKENFISGCYARIEQMKRHMWGSLDFGYTLRMGLRWSIGQGIQIPKKYFQVNGREPIMTRPRQVFNVLATFYHACELYIWPAHAFLVTTLVGFFLPFTNVTPPFLAPVSKLYWTALTGNLETPISSFLQNTLIIASKFQIGVFFPMFFSMVAYELYFHWVTDKRWKRNSTAENPGAAGTIHPKYGKRPATITTKRPWYQLIEWVLYAVAGIITSICLVIIGLLHLVTDRLDYKVSAKPTSNAPAAAQAASVTVAAPATENKPFLISTNL